MMANEANGGRRVKVGRDKSGGFVIVEKGEDIIGSDGEQRQSDFIDWYLVEDDSCVLN